MSNPYVPINEVTIMGNMVRGKTFLTLAEAQEHSDKIDILDEQVKVGERRVKTEFIDEYLKLVSKYRLKVGEDDEGFLLARWMHE